ncbi:Zn(II)2Cys6 transcription factor Ecym_5001 [Eremothecium cymbalariae DBVPG|uniref:Zn(2)-C6 fungal-type domain-containing protein n=1 Tax=Eremothecium cymbalariae (strain CBS 270.75 / DBVPG 7215 / KCTC 17166 / NRRL Y-17582) TaxID=931890 RepID=I6NCL2_ERECY|nr:hypothetical protein Ecym_5001 [Eremothecium cymbalariae DBVPG\
MGQRKRTVTGCLSCRRRKKKCDEQKPVCKGCQRNFIRCQWPDYSTGRIRRKRGTLQFHPRLPVDSNEFQITTLDSAKFVTVDTRELDLDIYTKGKCGETLYHYSKESNSFTLVKDFERDYDTPPIEKTNPLDELDAIDQDLWEDQAIQNISYLQPNQCSVIDIPFNELILNFQSKPLISKLGVIDTSPFTETEAYFYHNIITKYNKNEILDDNVFRAANMKSFLLYACIQGFIPKFGITEAYPNLNPTAAFLPELRRNSLLRNVFRCCGATYLAWKDLARFQRLSDEYYYACKRLLEQFIIENTNFAHQDWILISLQMLCVRENNSFNGTVDDTIWQLERSYQIIKLRYASRCLQQTCHILQPHERLCIESFIYHYAISILFATSISTLPSPFVIFKELSYVLKWPMYNCEEITEYFRSPVFGPSLDSYEILAKLSYIARMPMPLHPSWITKVIQLRNKCVNYKPVVQDTVWINPWLNRTVNNSIAGVLITRACYLLASKMINYDGFDLTNPHIQLCVKDTIKYYRELPANNQIWGILSWAILLTGSFANDADDRNSLLNCINTMAERTHSYSGIKIAAFLHDVWRAEKGKGINYLFDRRRLSQLVM